MKKLMILSAIAAALSANVHAQEQTKDNEKWVAGFVEYYSTDSIEGGTPNFLDNGVGFGAEYGFKFNPEWAARLEVSILDIDASPSDESGSRLGADVLYFLPDDIFYVFGGLKYTQIADADLMVNVGLGKHWDVGNSLKIITEVAAYQTLASGTNRTHVGFKLGLAYAFGKSTAPSMPNFKDSDNDGVFDNIDQCTNTAIGTQVDNVGCALDTDGDGVINLLDVCADTPAGTKIDAKGCSLVLDTDQDSIPDEQDQCADTPRSDKVDANGCSIFSEEEVSTNIRVMFGNNSSLIDNSGDQQFQNFADFMSRFPAADAVIEGHASAPGDADYNMMLSKKRAKSVRTLLINRYGIDAERLTAEGFGENQLLDTSNTAQAHSVNRRITAKASASKRIKLKK